MNPSAAARLRLAVVAILGLFTAACGSEASNETPPVAEGDQVPQLASDELGSLTADRVRLTLPWSDGNLRKQGLPGDTAAVLQGLSVTAESGFDRITAEFSGRRSVVSYEVNPASGPIESCGSEPSEAEETQHWVTVRFGRLSASEDVAGQAAGALGFGAIQEVRVVCLDDDELLLSVRVEGSGQHRIVEAADPNAVVVDFQH